MSGNKIIKFLVKDGIVEFEDKHAKLIGLYKDMSDDLGSLEEFPIENFNKETIEKIRDFCILHADNFAYGERFKRDFVPEYMNRNNNNTEIIDIDKLPNCFLEFIDLPKELIINIVNASNYLNIPDLLELGSYKISQFIKGMSVEEIRLFFNITNNGFSNEELKEINTETDWINYQ